MIFYPPPQWRYYLPRPTSGRTKKLAGPLVWTLMNRRIHCTSILVTNMFIKSYRNRCRNNAGTVLDLLTLNLGDKKAVKLAVKIRVSYDLTGVNYCSQESSRCPSITLVDICFYSLVEHNLSIRQWLNWQLEIFWKKRIIMWRFGRRQKGNVLNIWQRIRSVSSFRVRMLERICRFLRRLAPPCGNWRVVTDLRPTLKFIRRDFGGPIVFAKSLPTGGACGLARPRSLLWSSFYCIFISLNIS